MGKLKISLSVFSLVKGKGLGVSILFDPESRVWKTNECNNQEMLED